MLLLLLFALIAGAGTAITPCVLPVVPALLSASSLGGRRRPIGIVVGLGLTFTIAIVALAQLVKGVGLASGAARSLAIIVLIVFGIVLLIPELAERIAGAALAPGPLRAQDARNRLLVGHPGRRRARVRVRALRGADPGRGHVGQRLERRHRAGRRGRARLRGRTELGDAALRPRRPRRTRPCPPPHARPRGRAHARRRAAADRRADGVQRRRPLRGGPRQGHEPAVVPDRPDALARDLQRGLQPARVAAAAVALRRAPAPGGVGDAGRQRGRRSRSPGSRRRRCPSSAWRRTSPTLRTGSTRPGTGR